MVVFNCVGENVVEVFGGGIDELVDVVSGLFGGENGEVVFGEYVDGGDGCVVWGKIKCFCELEWKVVGEMGECVFGLFYFFGEVSCVEECELVEGDVVEFVLFWRWDEVGDLFDVVGLDWVVDVYEIDYFFFGGGGGCFWIGVVVGWSRCGEFVVVFEFEEFGKGVGEVVEMCFEFGVLECEEDVEEVLCGGGVV